MKPRIKLAEAKTSEGGTLTLFEHDGAYVISFNGQELMHTKMCSSEKLLGKLGTERLPKDQPARMMIGGLGLGFTLDSALNGATRQTTIDVVEMSPEVINWNRTHLVNLFGKLLNDPRVQILAEDVNQTLRKAKPATYDSIMLDVDNGPIALVATENNSLYSNFGLRSIYTALKPKGRVIIWSASPEPKFEIRLKRAGFHAKAVPAKTHPGAKRTAYVLYVGDK